MFKALLILGLGGILGGWLPANDESVPEAQASSKVDTALKYAPQGIRLSDFFDPGMGLNNRAKVIRVVNKQAKNTEAVHLTSGPQQTGGIWSNDQNTFDLGHEQTVSMWLFFGDKNSSAGDGMAFVLQNDPAGNGATSQREGQPIFGESLGVWGIDSIANGGDPKKIAQSAIQHSWALEFDTYLNRDQKDVQLFGQLFDQDLINRKLSSSPHIASNYPAEPTSYEQHAATDLKWRDSSQNRSEDKQSYVSLRHKGVLQTRKYSFLSDTNWHHLTLHYQPNKNGDESTGVMTYTFNDKSTNDKSINDKSPNDKFASEPLQPQQAQVDIVKKNIDPNHTGHARWGFTGSTGTAWEDNLIIFDQVPDLVDADATVKLTDVTQGKELSDQSVDNKVVEGDRIQLDYHVSYVKGRTGWTDIKAKLRLPDDVSFDTGVITKSSDGEQMPISKQVLTEKEIDQSIAAKLDEKQPAVDISLQGHVKEGATQVSSKISHFYGKEAVAEAITPKFRVAALNKLKIRLDQDNFALSAGQQAKIKGTVEMGDQAVTGPVQVGLYLGEERIATKTPTDQKQTFEFALPAADLKEGPNELQVRAQAEGIPAADPVTVHVFLGKLGFSEITSEVAFQANLTGKAQQVYPIQAFHLKVGDTRSQNNDWTVTARADIHETDGRQPLAGQIEYVNDNGEHKSLTAVAENIATHKKSISTQEITEIAGDRTSKHGLLLHVDSSAIAGEYSGSIVWELKNAI